MKKNSPGVRLAAVLVLAFTLHSRAAERQFLHGHLPPAVTNMPTLGRLPASQRLSLAIGLPLRNQPGLTALLQQIYDPASPQYHHYLTPEEFTAQFGPTEQDYQTVVAFAKTNGLTVTATHPGRLLLEAEAPVVVIERVLNVTLRTYQHPTEARTFYSPDTEPSLGLAVPIISIGGLNNYLLPRPNLHAAGVNRARAATPQTGSAPSGNYWGNDFRAAYVPGVTLTGTGQSVGLLEFDGYYTSDIIAYENSNSIPHVTLSNVLLDGFDGTPGGNDDEVSLDIEMAVSMAPGLSQVIVYEGELTDTVLGQMAEDDTAKQLSASWTYPIDALSDQYFLQFAAQGQSFFNASGDSDAYSAANSVPTPSDDTNITIVGGTTLTTSGPGGNWVSEKAWNWGYDANAGYDVGTSGGISTTYGIPNWQQGINMSTNKGSTTMRNLPDVALTADNVWVLFGDGDSGEYGGTSCATPLWAAFIALVNQQAVADGKPTVGFINPAVYALGKSSGYATDFHDITTGNNTNSGSPNLFFACPGYDLCTGWGTPNGQNMIYALTSPEGLQITPAQGFASAGPFGGPFTPTNQTFVLTNVGTAALSWSVGNTSLWLNVSPSGGALATNGPATSVTVTLAAASYTLAPGSYVANLDFTNLADSTVQTRQFTLQISEPFQVTPALGFASSGAVGGPFTISNLSFTLTNLGGATINWRVGNTSTWMSASSSSGSLPPGGPASTVTLSLSAAAYSLPLGSYTNVVWFTNLADGSVQSRQFTLQTIEPLQITPATGFASSGPGGGPFTVTSENFTLANEGNASLNWSLSNTSLWLSVSSSSGNLGPGGSTTTVTVSLAAAAYSLTSGSYAATVTFTNLNDGSIQTRQFTLQNQPIVLNGGFETGTFADWAESGNIEEHHEYEILITTSRSYVHSGTYGAALGPVGNLGYLSQSLTTTAGQLYLLSLWLYGNGATPNQFQVDWNGTTLFNQSNIGNVGWTNLQFMVSASSTSTVLQFGFEDGASYLGLDDINVVPVAAPSFGGVVTSHGSIQLTWSTVSGASYQVQYTTNMLHPNWLNLGSPITASGTTATASDTIQPGTQRFYRTVLLP